MGKRLSEKNIKLLEELSKQGNIPEHVAIIMDGNGRWANKKGLPRVAGHRKGVETVRGVLQACTLIGVKYLTLYTFSTENWNRPKDEVSTLMRLIVKTLQHETNELHHNNVKITTIGGLDNLPLIVKNELNEAMQKTKDNSKLTLNLALNYSGRWELVEAVKSIAESIKNDDLKINEINEKLISNRLSTKEIPDPDLLIRSGGEYRVSNFLLWQIAYSEIFISQILWPEFKIKHFAEAIKSYQNRERRFGLVSEQISNKDTDSKNGQKVSNQMV